LLEAIVADIDALEPRLVYADALIRRGDPRGDLIVAQHRLLLHPTDHALAEHVRALVVQVVAQLAAPALATRVIAGWWLGFVDELRFDRKGMHAVMEGGWLRQPALRTVRTLDLPTGPAGRMGAVLRILPSVRAVRVGDRRGPLARDVLRTVAVPGVTSVVVRALGCPPLAAAKPH
jgi:uncharacterized protein (TIGR02996 family)